MNYIDDRRNDIKKIHEMYNENISDIIKIFVDIPEVLRMENINETSGGNITKFVAFNIPYTILDHCVGVALILDKFINDNKQVISGLLHGMNKSAFSEAIKHTSEPLKEKSVYDAIVASDQLFDYLMKENIAIREVSDYLMYPLVKTTGTRMDANSIENILHTSYINGAITEDEFRKIYEDLTITKNEDSVFEFAFNTHSIGEKFSKLSLEIAKKYRSYEAKISIKIIATLLELMIKRGEINVDDLYKYGDKAIYEMGVNSSDRRISSGWQELKKIDKVYTKFNPVEDKFCVKVDVHVKYVDPLVKLKGGFLRASKVSLTLKDEITQFLNSDTDLYMYGDFVI